MRKLSFRASRRVVAEDQTVSVDAVRDLLHDLVDALEVDEDGQGFSLDLDEMTGFDSELGEAEGGHAEPDGDEFGADLDEDGDDEDLFEDFSDDVEDDDADEDEMEKSAARVQQASHVVASLDEIANQVQVKAAAHQRKAQSLRDEEKAAKHAKKAKRLLRLAARIDAVSNEIEARIKGGNV